MSAVWFGEDEENYVMEKKILEKLRKYNDMIWKKQNANFRIFSYSS